MKLLSKFHKHLKSSTPLLATCIALTATTAFAAGDASDWVGQTNTVFDTIRDNLVLIGASILGCSFVGQSVWYGASGRLDPERFKHIIIASILVGIGGTFMAWIFSLYGQ